MTTLAPYLTAFLREHLPRQRNASAHTVATYAHAFALLVRFAADRVKRRPSDLAIEDIDPELVLAFLIMWRPNAVTQHGRGTHRLLRSDHSSAILSTRLRPVSNRHCEFGRCQRNGPINHLSTI